jgi:hypothetical protein
VGSLGGLLGPPIKGVPANRLIWEFFQKHARRD